MKKQHTNILVLGGGIGGYEAYRTLAKGLKRHGLKQTITVIDQNNYFTFTPMLHEVATGVVEASHCAIPLRALVEAPHQFVRAKVINLNPEKQEVTSSAGTFTYDYVVAALGSAVNYFKTPGAAENTYNVRTMSAAMKLQERIIDLLENCENKLSFTVVGGSYTGVEIAGQLTHFLESDIHELYPEKKISINLVQAADSLVPILPEKTRKFIQKSLEKKKVIIYLNSRATEVTKKSLILANKTTIDSDLVIWAAGFENIGACYISQEFCEQGRVPVNNFLQHEKFSSLYAVGDIMLAKDEAGFPYPQLGEAAHKEGWYVAKHLLSILRKKKIPKPFYFKSTGTILPLGNWQAVAQFGPIFISGPFAWWLRRTAYVLFLPGLAHKFKIILDWTLHRWGHRYIIDLGEEAKPKA
ncbi:MAG: NAD(P)/FAD-dependent oxidoreductase [Candidatus Magasanikbacteria bacterium]|nr:NAD(P)/FAD-dependent oxidoreductase [Candidatus Magasanikbacteria bacterium]